jgi:hypothetical protein
LWHDACTGLSGQLDVCLICDPDQELFHASPSHVVEEQEPLTPDQCKNGVEVVHEQYGRGVVIEAPPEESPSVYGELLGKCRVSWGETDAQRQLSAQLLPLIPDFADGERPACDGCGVFVNHTLEAFDDDNECVGWLCVRLRRGLVGPYTNDGSGVQWAGMGCYWRVASVSR